MAGVDSAAARRRQRRLRQFLRHERLSVAMVLAESQHSSKETDDGKGQGERHELHYTAKFRRRQPAPLSEVAGWQSRVSRNTMDQIVDAVPGLPTLDGPVPLMVEQLVDVLQLFDALIPVAEQVVVFML